MALVYVIQHAEKAPMPGDPGLTERGREQAIRTARWLGRAGLGAVYSSPLRRARETADPLSAATGLPVTDDDRLRERMNWDGSQPMREFLADWARCGTERDFVPVSGQSSRQAGDRFLGFLTERAGDSVPFAVVTHGGVTVDLLRTLLGERAVPTGLIETGIPSCAVTLLDGRSVIQIAGTTHLG